MNPSDPTAWQSVAWFAFAAVSVVGMLHLCRQFYLSFKEQPPADQKYQTKEASEKAQADNAERIKELESLIELVRAEHSNDLRQLREEMEEMRRSFNASMREVHARIDQLPAQIITILSNTGALKTR